MKSFNFVVLICCVVVIEAYPTSNCSDALTCDACIADPVCAWCLDPQPVSTPRCFHPRTSNCREEYSYDPMNTVEILRAKDFPHSSSSSRDHQNSDGHSKDFERNYMTPEHVRASLRVGSEYRLKTFYVVKEDVYEQQSLHISLTDNSSKFLNVRYFTKCKTERETETNKCDLVKVGDKVPYTISITLLSCPANAEDWNQKLQIRPENLNGQLTVDLKLFCSCPAPVS